jgi:hypothetical protein
VSSFSHSRDDLFFIHVFASFFFLIRFSLRRNSAFFADFSLPGLPSLTIGNGSGSKNQAAETRIKPKLLK